MPIDEKYIALNKKGYTIRYETLAGKSQVRATLRGPNGKVVSGKGGPITVVTGERQSALEEMLSITENLPPIGTTESSIGRVIEQQAEIDELRAQLAARDEGGGEEKKATPKVTKKTATKKTDES